MKLTTAGVRARLKAASGSGSTRAPGQGASASQGPGPKVPPPKPLVLNFDNLRKYHHFERLLGRVTGVPGDVVECGVGYGDSFIMLSLLARREGQLRRVWGFDSFAGFQEPTAEDASGRGARKGEWASDLGMVRERLLRSGLDEHFVNRQATLVAGYFEESLSLFRGTQIALLHLDCDLYGSYSTCLEELYPRIPAGGVVTFDEYVNTMQLASFPGARKAIDEYLGDDVSRIQSDPETGQYFLVK